MFGEPQKPILPHPRSGHKMRTPKNQIPSNSYYQIVARNIVAQEFGAVTNFTTAP